MKEVPRHTSLVPLVLYFVNWGGNRRVFRLPGAGGTVSIVRWNLRPVTFGVEWWLSRPGFVDLELRPKTLKMKIVAEPKRAFRMGLSDPTFG